MTIGLLFWVLYVVALVFTGWGAYTAKAAPNAWGGSLLFFVLVGLLGWQTFGPVVHR